MALTGYNCKAGERAILLSGNQEMGDYTEINQESKDIVCGGNEWSCSQCRVNIELPKEKRNKCTEGAGEKYYSDQADPNT